jgi:hypothetical protein
VDVFLDSGFLTALGSISETVPLGNLAVGTYDYTMTLHPSMDIPFGRDMRVVNGAFTVVPEPSALLLAIGLAMTLMVRRARRGA